jgi:perosamine synthetase
MFRKNIPVARPNITFSSVAKLMRAILKKEVSGYSKQYLPQFEAQIAKYVGTKNAVLVNSGTSAIHLALIGIGIKAGDKVAVSSYTNMATFFPILQLGAIPIPVDIESRTWNMDPSDLEKVISQGLKAIVVVHIFGHPANMIEIMQLAERYGVPVVEDCAEALGATHYSQKVGGIGIVGCHSFYANKMITTGEGGALTTNNDDIARRAQDFRSLSFGIERKFIHSADGYNFRMTNLQAAVGVGQLQNINRTIRHKRYIAKFYTSLLRTDDRIQLPVELDNNFSVVWMYHIRLKNFNYMKRDQVIKDMAEAGIEVREGFASYTLQEKVLKLWGQDNVRSTPLAELISEECLYLPSGPKISKTKMRYVVKSLQNSLNRIAENEKELGIE